MKLSKTGQIEKGLLDDMIANWHKQSDMTVYSYDTIEAWLNSWNKHIK